jgi:hypothetical protein
MLLAGTAVLSSAGQPTAGSAAKEAAMAVFRILQRQDWAALHATTAFSEKVADTLPTRGADFAAYMRERIGGGKSQALVDQMLGGMTDLAVGEADIQGDYAVLPTSCTLSLQGTRRAFKGSIHLIRRHHAWKWDLTFSDNAEDATSRALAELVGKPVDAKQG